jgi:acetylornithine deacetylase/succinyl-diaminopimelate desuccinylase-like protein
VLDGVDLTGTGTVGGRLWSKTSVNVIGIDAPDVATSRNALVNTARAKVSLRYPPEQDGAAARAALVRHLERSVPWNARVTVTPGVAGPGFAAVSHGPGVGFAHEALEEAYGKSAVQMGSGGSIPLVSAFAAAMPDADVVLWGTEEPASAMHAPNESVDIGELERASLAEALLLLRLGDASA